MALKDLKDREINININQSTIIKAVLVIILFLSLYLVRDLILVVLAAVVLASSVEPITKWFGRGKISIKRVPAVILVYLALGLVLAGLFIFFLPSLLNEAVVYLNNLPDTFSFNDLWNPLKESGFISTGQNTIDSLSSQSFSVKEIVTGMRDVISGTGEGVFKTANIVFGGALSFVLIIVLSFYLSVQEDGVGNFLRLITPVKSHEYVIDLWKRSQNKIGLWMQGQLILAAIIFILIYPVLVIFGVKHALLLATIAAMFEIIPVFGPILSAIPAIIISLVEGGTTMGILVTGWYVAVHQFENHLFYPLVVKKIVGISPIVVILALVIGAKLAGFLGAILAVPLASAFMEYVADVEKRKGSQSLI